MTANQKHNHYPIWINRIDDDGDYGIQMMCAECNDKSYRCTARTLVANEK